MVGDAAAAPARTFVHPDTAGNDVASFTVAAVDTTGAGDGFMAGLLTGLLEHPDEPLTPSGLTRMCRFANAAGALTTTSAAAIPALPSRAAVTALITEEADR